MNHISPIEALPSAKQYLKRIKAQMRSLFKAAVTKKISGYDREIAVIVFNRSGEVEAPEGYLPTESELEGIAREILTCDFPVLQKLSEVPNANLPQTLLETKSEDMYTFRDREGMVVMLQQRVELSNGDKRYVPWTYWSDGQWRRAEPDDGLPLWGLENVSPGDRVFVHEGAKAARAAHRIAIGQTPHAWADYLATGSHVGYIGGVHQVRKNLWDELKGIGPSELIIVPDNDGPGQRAVPKISVRFRCRVSQMLLDDCWPRSWDLADPIPASMFNNHGDYTGVEPEMMVRPADWAIDEIPQGRGAPLRIIRDEFAERWVRIQQTKTYAAKDRPWTMLDRDQFNTVVAPFSRVADTAAVLGRTAHSVVDAPTFRPDVERLIIDDGAERLFNMYLDLRVKPEPGDTEIFYKFMEYLVPDATDREHLLRWCSTIYCHPEIRMGYGVLAMSQMQGVGKTTLGMILSRMIGMRQVSFPGDNMIVNSDFNGWVINKRLIVVNEIYAGQNWKAYNKLKSLVTDETVEANIKFMPSFTTPNWAHFYCCSNSLEALRIENDDRRWLVPGLAEDLWSNADYIKLRSWMSSGGLKHLAHEWMSGRHETVTAQMRAPGSVAKDELIEASKSTDQILLDQLLAELRDEQLLETGAVWLWLREATRGHTYMSPRRLCQAARDAGYAVSDRVKVGGKMVRVIGVGGTNFEGDRKDLHSRIVDPALLKSNSQAM